MREIRFRCQAGCTRCCRGGGFVYLTEADLRPAARFLDLSVPAFEKRYVYRTRHLLRLRKLPGAECPFLEEGGCGIHPAKPTQCRAYPFWPELVESVKTWRAAGRVCPGIGKGKLVQIGTAMETAQTMRAGYPTMY
jgi:Fe-S-cluster containining protein